jgi:hypothetical protein
MLPCMPDPWPDDVDAMLRTIRDKAAMVSHHCDLAAASDELPTPFVFSGLADACAEIERLADRLRTGLDVATLGMNVEKRSVRTR